MDLKQLENWVSREQQERVKAEGEIKEQLKVLNGLIIQIPQLRADISRLDLAMGAYKDLDQRLKDAQRDINDLKKPEKKEASWLVRLLEKKMLY